MRKGFAVFVVAAALAGIGAPLAGAAPNNSNATKLLDAVTAAGVMAHEEAFQQIADANGGTRASGTPGYEASVEYVVGRLTAAGYAAEVQEFEFPFFQELRAPVLERVAPGSATYDTATFTFSGSGDVTAPATLVDVQIPPAPTPSSTSGCQPDDFLGFPAGNVAVLQRGTCTFAVKAFNAQMAGASAVVIFNEGQPGRTGVVAGTLGGPVVTIPVVGASFATGEDLYGLRNDGLVLHVSADTISETRPTSNVIAETAGGRDDNVVVVGAHLDSVAAGPGINDNGSGSSTILEVALQMAKVNPRNTVRFIWFGAEELGLLGSRYYVGQLTPEERADIALNLNFDMVGSPNFVRFVYDGDNSAFPVGPGAAAGPPGSGYIEKVFVDYFSSQGLASEPTAFSGRSDYGPFIEVGIPAGGLFTGAEGIKTPEQAVIYGGTAGIPYDPCYHQACDTIANVNVTAIDQMADATAYAVITFAQNTAGVNGEKGKGNFKPKKLDPETDGAHAEA
ncbi:MAG TPA: M28 family metallopeptidase [Acidimicrobiales bacterium]|nr:M28 family metallopeptidase [Acidimicrobiales bacterium]